MTDPRAVDPHAPPRHPDLLHRDDARLLIVDVQERLVPAIADVGRVVARCGLLIRGARLFDVPIACTEQYPQGLGPTTPELAGLLRAGETLAKREFSAVPVLDWARPSDDFAPRRDQVVVAGIESHVCILQSVFDLLAAGFRTYVAADAVGSRAPLDRETALRRMADAGAVLVTAESVLFEWCGSSADPRFRDLSRLVKES